MLVLIVEREKNAAEALRLRFEHSGHSAVVIDDDTPEDIGFAARDLGVDAVILGSLASVYKTRRLRESGFVGALIGVAVLSVQDRIAMLGAGADDAVAKPFHGDEVVARAEAVARRYAGHPDSRVFVGDLAISEGLEPARINGREVHLTGTELRILQFLALRKGKVVTKETIYDRLYSGVNGDGPEMKIIDVLICKLRQRLFEASGGKHYIETAWGRGYSLVAPDLCKPPKRYKTASAAGRFSVLVA